MFYSILRSAHYALGALIALCLMAAPAMAGSNILVIANKAATPGALPVDSPETKAAVQRVASYFTDKGLTVIDQRTVQQMHEEVKKAGNFDFNLTDNDLIKLALSKDAGLLVKVEVFTLPTGKGDDTASARAIGEMFDVSTGRKLAMSEQYGTNVIRGTNGLAAARHAAVSKAGARVGVRMYSKLEKNHSHLLEQLLRPDLPGYLVVIGGFGESDNDIILMILEEDMGLGPKGLREKKVTSGLMELEVFTDDPLGKFTRKLKRAMSKEGLEVEEKTRDESRVILVQPGSDSLFGQIDRK
ncbi:MAG: hypothetical protein ACNI3A_19070 [Desulfovibrio sp.]|uniref:hypothetical protein n=1 Tax=Desulfovibrio sp. 7SRBS1 TaxID=3378064 RepID=UPI003B3E1C7A